MVNGVIEASSRSRREKRRGDADSGAVERRPLSCVSSQLAPGGGRFDGCRASGAASRCLAAVSKTLFFQRLAPLAPIANARRHCEARIIVAKTWGRRFFVKGPRPKVSCFVRFPEAVA